MKKKKSVLMDELCKGGMSKEAARDFLKAMPADSYEDDDGEDSADMEDMEKSLARLASNKRYIEALEADIDRLTSDNNALTKSLIAADEISENSVAAMDTILAKSLDAFRAIEENQAILAKGIQDLAAKYDNLTKSLGAPVPARSLSGSNVAPAQGASAGNVDRVALDGLFKSMYAAAKAKGNPDTIRAVARVEMDVRDGRMTPADARVALQGLN